MNIRFDQIYDGNKLIDTKFNCYLSTLFINLSIKDKSIIFNHKGMKYIYFDNINDHEIDIIYDCNLDLTKFKYLVGNNYTFHIIKGLFNIETQIVDLKLLIEKHNGINMKKEILDIENESKIILKNKSTSDLINNNKNFVSRNISCPSFIESYSTNDIFFVIITNEKIASIAEGLKIYFDYFNFKSKIQFSFDKKLEKKNEIYILLYIKYFTEQKNEIPENYIVYQLEQIRSNMFTKEYYKLLRLSKYIFDFSEANNFYYNQIRSQVIINNFPICLEYNNFDSEFDILFYGELNIRRSTILNHLKKYCNLDIKVVSDILGEEKNNLIKKCKIVLNLHFYQNACLETCRINEVLKYNKIVISEEPKDEDFLNKELYSECVQYVDIIKNDISNIKSLINKIKYCLDNYEYILNNMNRNKIQNFCRNQFFKNINYIINEDLQSK